MRFGESTAEAEANAANRAATSGAFIKYLRKGDNEIQIIDEYDKWTWYWEHYNPGGYPFPCTRDRNTCPGCTSPNEKMKNASYRAAFNAYDGQYTNVWKIPKTVAEKLKNRFDRLGTITDRPYVITQIQNEKGFYDYDIEGQDMRVLDMSEISQHTRDPEDLLAAAYEEAWGDSAKAQATTEKAENASRFESLEKQVNEAVREREETQRKEPPFEEAAEEKTYSEAELRAMEPDSLRKLCTNEGLGDPGDLSSNEIVDWMIEKLNS